MVVAHKLEGDKLVITVDVSKKARAAATPAKTPGSNNKVIASSGGFQPVQLPDGEMIKFMTNVIVRA